MTSKISVTYDAVITMLETLFPNKTRIPNTYSITDNSDLFMRDGYGLRVDGSSFSESEFCNFSRLREFTVTLTRELLRDESDYLPYDVTVKLILEDVYTLQKNFLNANQLGQEASIEKIDFSNTSAIEEFKTDQNNFLSMDVTFPLQVTDLLELL